MEALIEQMKMVYDLMGSNEFAESVAKMLWNIYKKCIEQGFAQDEAMAITLSFSKSQGTTK